MKAEEIYEKYPNVWIALTDLEFCGCCDSRLTDATVAATAETKEELEKKLPKNQHFFIFQTTEEGLRRAGLTD